MAMRAWHAGPFLISAAPGAGKTRPALVLARELLRAGAVRRVAVVCPTTPLTRQWAQAAGRLGVHLVPDAAELRPPRDFDGVAVTYARVAQRGARWAKQCSGRHARDRRRGAPPRRGAGLGRGLRAGVRRRRRRLLLSGTPFRSDAAPIPGVRYDATASPSRTSPTRYADAVRDGICRPVTFVPYDGVLQWRSRATMSSRRRSPTRSPAARRRAATAPRSRRARRRPAAHPAAGPRALLELRAGGPPRRRRPRRRRRRRARPRGREGAARGHAA